MDIHIMIYESYYFFVLQPYINTSSMAFICRILLANFTTSTFTFDELITDTKLAFYPCSAWCDLSKL